MSCLDAPLDSQVHELPTKGRTENIGIIIVIPHLSISHPKPFNCRQNLAQKRSLVMFCRVE